MLDTCIGADPAICVKPPTFPMDLPRQCCAAMIDMLAVIVEKSGAERTLARVVSRGVLAAIVRTDDEDVAEVEEACVVTAVRSLIDSLLP